MPCHLKSPPHLSVLYNIPPVPVGAEDCRVDLLDALDVLHEHLTQSLCEDVYESNRTTERNREWTLATLSQFWTAVVLRAPKSLTQALQEAARGRDELLPHVETTEEAFFQKCKGLHWKFFHALYYRYTQNVLPEAEPLYAQSAAGLMGRFPNLFLIDGSRLDAVAHRLKIAQKTRKVLLPGCLTACYDLFRGITRQVLFDPDAAKAELNRARQIVPAFPKGSLWVGDRLYASIQFFWDLENAGQFGVFRFNRTVGITRKHLIGRGRTGDGGRWEEWLVEAGSGQTAPKIMLRLIVWKKKGEKTRKLLTNILDPGKLTAEEALALYPLRWQVERLFNDLKTVLNLNRFYAANPNAVAMQVYATAIVHTTFRIAQGRIAKRHEISPDWISTAKLFPKLAVASIYWSGAELGFHATCRANPGVDLAKPNWHREKFAQTTLGAICVERRNEHRRARRFCKSRRRWTSFTRLPGGRKLT